MDAGNEEVKIEEIVKNPNAKKKIVPNWLMDVLAWIKRIEMANSALSTSCWTFKQLCWPKLHGKVKPFKIKWMEFWPKRDESGNIRAKLLLQKVQYISKVPDIDSVPIAQIAPPKYIIGFERIIIHWLDAQILQFMEIIRPLLLNDLFLTLGMYEWNGEHDENAMAQVQNFAELLNNKIFAFSCFYGLFETNRDFPGLLDQIQIIKEYYGQIEDIFQWLSSRNNHQKIAKIRNMNREKFAFIGRIMHKFLSATQPANYLIISNDGELIDFDGNRIEFTLENERTGEILTCYHKRDPTRENDTKMYALIARHPKGEEHWKEQGEQKYWPFLLREPYSDGITLDIHSRFIEMQNREQRADVEEEKQGIYETIINLLVLAAMVLILLYIFIFLT